MSKELEPGISLKGFSFFCSTSVVLYTLFIFVTSTPWICLLLIDLPGLRFVDYLRNCDLHTHVGGFLEIILVRFCDWNNPDKNNTIGNQIRMESNYSFVFDGILKCNFRCIVFFFGSLQSGMRVIMKIGCPGYVPYLSSAFLYYYLIALDKKRQRLILRVFNISN